MKRIAWGCGYVARRCFSSRKGRLRSDVESLVACNIFITAGGQKDQHRPLLTSLVGDAQKSFHAQLSPDHTDPWAENGLVGALIYAHCDPVYNRTSFLLAGTASVIADVAKELAIQAVKELRSLHGNIQPPWKAELQYPSVGHVDNVSVMPLVDVFPRKEFSYPDAVPPAGQAARIVGSALRDQLDILVFFYGHAQRRNRDYTDVRRKHFRYMKRLSDLVPPGDRSNIPEMASVGAPNHYVEQFFVRMNAICGKRRARHLRRIISEYEGKLPYVDALSLPYTDDRFDIACLLQKPNVSRADDIISRIGNYVRSCKDGIAVESSFRIGPTALKCLESLRNVTRSIEKREEHDAKLHMVFSSYFN